MPAGGHEALPAHTGAITTMVLPFQSGRVAMQSMARASCKIHVEEAGLPAFRVADRLAVWC
jgi:hypothetical protein